MSRCQCTSPSSGLALPVLSRWAVKLSSLENSLHHFCLLWVLLSLKSFHAQRLSGDISITACIRKIRTSGTRDTDMWRMVTGASYGWTFWVGETSHSWERITVRDGAIRRNDSIILIARLFFSCVLRATHFISVSCLSQLQPRVELPKD